MDETSDEKYDDWFRERVRKGLAALDRGDFITHEEMGSRIKAMFDVKEY